MSPAAPTTYSDSFPLIRDPAALERRARHIQNVAVFISDPAVCDETLAKAQAMLDEAERLRELVKSV